VFRRWHLDARREAPDHSALHERGLDAPVSLKLGEDTLHEMCLAAIGVMEPNRN
jgi:hypothetical protein